MTLEILDPAGRLGDRDVHVAERTAVYAYNHSELGWGHINPYCTDEETEAQRVEVTCSTCHGHGTAEVGVSWFSRLPTNERPSGQSGDGSARWGTRT